MLKFDKTQVAALLARLQPTDKITLVGDHGVYLMSFAQKRVLPEDGPRTCVYAKGCNPDIDDDFYDNKEAEFGGDDGHGEIGTVATLQKIVDASTNEIHVILTATTVRVQNDGKRSVSKPKIDPNLIPPELRKYL